MTTVSPVSFFPPAGVSGVDSASPGDGNDEFAAALSQTTRKLTGDEGGNEASTDKPPSGDSIGAAENSSDADVRIGIGNQEDGRRRSWRCWWESCCRHLTQR